MLARLAAVLAWLVVGVARAAPVATGAPAALPEGPERALVARLCGTGCHGLEVVTGTRRPPARWDAVVDDMVTRGAQGSDAEIEAVLAYLVRNFGDATAAAPPAVAPAPEAPPRVDGRFRAFDARDGRELWSADLGAAAHATPITYLGGDGRQYVAVMASGGGLLGSPLRAPTLRVYALP